MRHPSGRKPTPSAAILDSQSVKMGDQAGTRGVDAGKKINRRKRHVLTETLGLILRALVTPADVQDQDGATTLLEPVLKGLRRLQVIWVDSKFGVHWIAIKLWDQRRWGGVVAKGVGQKTGSWQLPLRRGDLALVPLMSASIRFNRFDRLSPLLIIVIIMVVVAGSGGVRLRIERGKENNAGKRRDAKVRWARWVPWIGWVIFL